MMRIIFGIIAGITLSILSYILFQPAIDRRMAEETIAWVFTRIPPPTHPDCHPRYRSWHNGIETQESR